MKKKELKKVCFRCSKHIDEKSNYYQINEFDKGKIIATDYTHRICWDEFLKQIMDLAKARNLMDRLEPALSKMGLIEPREISIK